MTIDESVEYLLNKHSKSRDDDRELFLAWLFYKSNLTEEERKAFEVLKEVLRKMPSLETLTRSRRKLQESNPLLRGEKYNARMTREKQLRKFFRQK